MDEEIAIIDSNTRLEKIKVFFSRNKKKIIYIAVFILLILIGYFSFNELNKRQKIKTSNLYNSAIINFSEKNKDQVTKKLIEIIKKKDPTYSPLSLFFLIDNNLILESKKINDLFDTVIFETNLEKEIKNLIIYKKGLFNADLLAEDEILDILSPLINSESIWSSHALYLLAEYFYFNDEKIKSKEFFEKVLTKENANPDIVKEVKKRLKRDF
tara:strand:+ start:627 stop:1265 length:639 start_codon:yes stop_codon:yes gene_type:complete